MNRPITCAVFISYRRNDAGGHAGRLYDRLRHWFDEDVVFYDFDGIDMGDSFPVKIEAALDGAAVVLILIGPDWLAQINGRIGQPGVDFVRREVELALARHTHGVLVLPVLLGAAVMPAAHQFHADLQTPLAPLCSLNAHAFQGKQTDWDNQFVALRTRIAAVPGIPAPRFRAPAGAERPYRVIEHMLSPHFRDPNGLLAGLCRQLADSGSTALLARAALYGMGGIGKTQLALKYSKDYRDLYAGVWWFRAESETTLHLDAQDCCNACGAPAQPGEAPTAALKRWLARQTAPWLLVFDNAEDVAALRPHLPEGGLHHVLITSRNPAWSAVARAMELAVWTPKQGAEFLAGRLPGAAPADLLLLAADLGGLPLALEQAASYIDETGTTVTNYRALLAAVDTEGLILDEGRIATGYERTVLATLSLAFAKLSPAASQLLRLLAYAAPEPLPERFLREATDELPAELAEAATNPLLWNRVAGELRAYGLAERPGIADLDREAGEITHRTESALSLHRLTQQTIRAKLALPDEDCHRLLAVLRQSCPTETDLPKHWPLLAALTPHVTQLDRYHANGWLDSRKFSWLLDRVGSYLQVGPALYADSARWLRRAWEIDRQELGVEHPDTLTSMNNLANTLYAQGDLAGALELQKSALATRRRVLGEEHPDTLSSMNNLAGTLHAQGDLAGALELHRSELATCRRVLGEDHPETLSTMNNLANTLMAQGDLAGALELQKSVLATWRRVLGEDHPDTLTSINNLALTLKAQGDLVGALELQNSALATQRRVLGEDHPATLISMSNLASTLWTQGDLAGALELQKSVLATRRRVLGEGHPDSLSSMINLSNTLQAHGDLVGALELQKSVLT
ncbi:MAG: FxSxx-COOH system tetratricopeptide repeat protein, partial [Sulfuritalea sp.]|nr:FxSxx-COOH system tetratricopeptide repeat protein [Sulfuritalea sp.]